jgi:hypothetical protein
VDGITYLRSDLSVECWTGHHSIAALLAYVVLCVIGFGFPAGLALILSRATPQQLASSAFHGTWGFLFNGYRLPTHAPRHSRLSSMYVGGTRRLTKVFTPGIAIQQSLPDTGATPAQQSSPRLADVAVGNPRGTSLVWWESMVLLRKAGIVLLAVLVTNPYMQCVGAILWLGGHLLLQLHFKPFVESRFNRLEAL